MADPHVPLSTLRRRPYGRRRMTRVGMTGQVFPVRPSHSRLSAGFQRCTQRSAEPSLPVMATSIPKARETASGESSWSGLAHHQIGRLGARGVAVRSKRLEVGTFQQLDPAACTGRSSGDAGTELTTTELALLLTSVCATVRTSCQRPSKTPRRSPEPRSQSNSPS